MDVVNVVRQIAQALIARRKKWILLATLGSLVVLAPGAYWLSKEPPRFRTSATVLIETKPDQVPIFQEFSPRRPIPVQMAILRSRSLAESVIETLPRESVEDLIQNQYDRDYLRDVMNWIRRLRGEEPVVESPQRRALAELQRARVRFNAARNSGLVELVAEASKPRTAIDIANAYLEALLSRTRSFNVDDAKATREYLEQQHGVAANQLGQAEEALRQFTLSRGGVRVPVRSNDTVTRLGQLENNLAEVQANRNTSAARLNQLKAKMESMPPAPKMEAPRPGPAPAPASAARVQRLRAKLASLEAQLLEFQTRYTDEHPRVTLTKQQISEVQRDLADVVKETAPATAAAALSVPPQDRMAFGETVSALEASVLTISAQEDALKEQIASLRRNLTGLSRDEVEYARLTSEVDSTRQLRALLADKLGAARIREQGEMKTVKVIDPPSLPVPTANQRRMKFLGMAVMLSLVLGIGLPGVVEYFNRPVESEYDIQHLTGLPVLASVPVVRSRRTTVVPSGNGRPEEHQHEDYFLFTEAFRRLRVEIQLLGRETELRRVLVASALPGEGKSTVVVNLGHAFGEIGKHVILADADFHRPTLHRTLKTQNPKGLSDVLAGTGDLTDSMNEVAQGVWVMPRGTSPNALTRTGLGSGRLTQVLERMSAEAEYVIMDSSPILLIPDNLYMAAAADGILLVVQAGVTRPRELVRTKQILEKSGTPIIGVVLNQMPLRKLNQYYAYYKAYAKAEIKA
ncbi:MAG: polysaccharide biosynthesis tyrosine autokinase [Candidatus Rokubacteria bacterium]|nr:polysaccharide biosynthesis tyrosine autokinase [Candidatus Rokubacteria bacterium]